MNCTSSKGNTTNYYLSNEFISLSSYHLFLCFVNTVLFITRLSRWPNPLSLFKDEVLMNFKLFEHASYRKWVLTYVFVCFFRNQSLHSPLDIFVGPYTYRKFMECLHMLYERHSKVLEEDTLKLRRALDTLEETRSDAKTMQKAIRVLINLATLTKYCMSKSNATVLRFSVHFWFIQWIDVTDSNPVFVGCMIRPRLYSVHEAVLSVNMFFTAVVAICFNRVICSAAVTRTIMKNRRSLANWSFCDAAFSRDKAKVWFAIDSDLDELHENSKWIENQF